MSKTYDHHALEVKWQAYWEQHRTLWAGILTITGGNDLKATAAARAVADVNIEDPFEQPGPTRGWPAADALERLGEGSWLCRVGNGVGACSRWERPFDFPIFAGDFDTARDYQSVNDVLGNGGLLDGAGSVVAGGMVFVNSGYACNGSMAGNVLLAFAPEE